MSSKTITAAQLTKAFNKAPRIVENEGKKFIIRGISEYKRVAVQSAPWRIGQSGGGIPTAFGNLKEKHRTKIKGLEGIFGVRERDVRYAKFVHGGTRKMEPRPWLDFARQKADKAVQKQYGVFIDNVLKEISP